MGKNKMKKILFIPTYTYLSTPIFSNLLNKLNGYDNLYLDVEEQFNAPMSDMDFKNRFARVIKIRLQASNNAMVKLFRMYSFIKQLKKTIKEESPSMVVTTSDLSLSVRVIKRYYSSLPIVVLQSAMIANTGLEPIFKQKILSIFFTYLPPLLSRQNYFGNEYNDNIILLWGEYFKTMIQTKSRIEIIGDITFDNFPIKRDKYLKNKLLKEHSLDKDTQIIDICTSAFSGVINKTIEENLYNIYKELIITRKKLFFIIKTHPREEQNRLTFFIDKYKPKNTTITKESLHELFKYTDIHISSFSRTALEALASNIPILSINPNNEIELEDFFKNELNEKVTSIEEMLFKIDNLLESTDEFMLLREKYIKKMLYRLDGKATDRAVAIIKEELLKNG